MRKKIVIIAAFVLLILLASFVFADPCGTLHWPSCPNHGAQCRCDGHSGTVNIGDSWQINFTNCGRANPACHNHSKGNCTELIQWRLEQADPFCDTAGVNDCPLQRCILSVVGGTALNRDCQGHPCAAKGKGTGKVK